LEQLPRPAPFIRQGIKRKPPGYNPGRPFQHREQGTGTSSIAVSLLSPPSSFFTVHC
jgi:hypothetical protein